METCAERYTPPMSMRGAARPQPAFEELKKRSRIKRCRAGADQAPDFSQRIRAGLPGMTGTKPD